MPKAFSWNTYFMSNLYAKKRHFTSKSIEDQPRSFADFDLLLFVSSTSKGDIQFEIWHWSTDEKIALKTRSKSDFKKRRRPVSKKVIYILYISFVLTLFIFKAPNYVLARTLTKRIVQPGTKPNPNPHTPRGCPSNSLGPVWANMYSHPFSSTTPAGAGIDNPSCVKCRETLPSQEESVGRDIPMGQLVTKVLVSRESPLPPCQLWPGRNSPVPRRWEPGPDRCPHPRVDCGWMSVVRTPRKKIGCVWCRRTQFQWTC